MEAEWLRLVAFSYGIYPAPPKWHDLYCVRWGVKLYPLTHSNSCICRWCAMYMPL